MEILQIFGVKPCFPRFVILILLQFLKILCQESERLEIRVSPSSILVPTSTYVEFECVAYCMEACNIIWFINGTPTEHQLQKDDFIEMGFSFSNLRNPSNSLFGSRLSVTASDRVNNTQLWCEAEINSDHVMSSTAMLLVIPEPLVIPNPFIMSLPTSFILEWSPPYLWAGYHISYYNISIINTTDGAVTYDVINAAFNDSVVTHYIYISRQEQECTEFIFGISAVSTAGEVLQSYEVIGQHKQVLMDFDMPTLNITVLFYANITPIVRMKIKLPSMICDHQDVNYTIIINSVNDTNIIELGPFYLLGSGSVQHDIVSDRLMRDEEYSVRVILFTYLHTVTSHNHSFDTIFYGEVESIPPVCTDAVSNQGHNILSHNLILSIICAGVTLIILSLAILVISVCGYLKLQQKRKTTDTSAERVCNAMVPNPIYSGPLYESVQPRFETLISTTTSTCEGQQCNSRASTPTSFEKSARYIDPPSHLPKNRSKSFVSSGPFHSSMLTVDAANTPRSTSVSIPAIKKTGKQRNKFNLTLTLSGTDSTSTTGSHHAQNSTTESISAVNPAVLRDVDENYTVMSPASALNGTAKLNELSPEDTDKYKE